MKSIRKLAGAMLMALALTRALADPINGEIAFSGNYTVDNTNLTLATALTSFSGVKVLQGTGDYASAVGADVTMAGFSFAALPATGVTQWQLSLLPTTSFDLMAITVDFRNATTLVLSGTGVAHMAGKDDYTGAWNLTANTFGSTFAFSGGTSVPDTASTALMLCMGLVGVGVARRRR